eukprot:gene11044-3750_t
MCHAVFVQGRNYSTSRPYIPELGIYQNVVDVKVNLEGKFIESRARVDKPVVRSTAHFTSLGCIIDKDPQFKYVPPTEKYKESTLKVSRNVKIQKLIDEQFASTEKNTRAIVVAVNGTIVGERYAPEFKPNMVQLGWSMTKSIVNTLYGMRVLEGKVKIEEKINAKEWNKPNDPRKEITIDDMLRMTSGLYFSEEYDNPLSDVVQMLYYKRNYASFSANKPLLHKPKTKFYYSSGTSNILSRRLRETFSSDQEYWNYPKKLFQKLGMSSNSIIETDAVGDFVGSSYAFLTPRDWLKYGMLYLQNGIWNGERILPESWVKYTIASTPSSNGRYGAHWWLSGKEIFQAQGHEGQVVAVHPKSKTVIVRLGFSQSNWGGSAFIRNVINAAQQNQKN